MNLIIDDTALGDLDNKSLKDLFLKVRAMLNAANRKRKDPEVIKNLQIDMCYLQREIELRSF
jgi:hypothetical protein